MKNDIWCDFQNLNCKEYFDEVLYKDHEHIKYKTSLLNPKEIIILLNNLGNNFKDLDENSLTWGSFGSKKNGLEKFIDILFSHSEQNFKNKNKVKVLTEIYKFYKNYHNHHLKNVKDLLMSETQFSERHNVFMNYYNKLNNKYKILESFYFLNILKSMRDISYDLKKSELVKEITIVEYFFKANLKEIKTLSGLVVDCLQTDIIKENKKYMENFYFEFKNFHYRESEKIKLSMSEELKKLKTKDNLIMKIELNHLAFFTALVLSAFEKK